MRTKSRDSLTPRHKKGVVVQSELGTEMNEEILAAFQDSLSLTEDNQPPQTEKAEPTPCDADQQEPEQLANTVTETQEVDKVLSSDQQPQSKSVLLLLQPE